jgi:DNA invertase Pin-like site-specific DNA recombinase
VEQQRAEIEAFCQEHGLQLVQVFADVAKSGGSTVGREQFLDMIDLSEEAETRPAGLLLWNFARFARDLDDSSYYKATLRKRGLVVHSISDPIPEGPYGRVVETILDIANEEKRRQMGRDIKRALHQNVSSGLWSGGPAPKGYRLASVVKSTMRNGVERMASRLELDPELIDLVRFAWGLRAQGKTYGEIREATYGRLFTSKNSWNAFFTNKTYLGIGKCGDLEIPGNHPAAISLETWNKVQAIREAEGRPVTGSLSHPRRVGNPYLLSGLAFCLHCGAAMQKDKSGERGWDHYICGRKRRHGFKSCEGRMVGSKAAETAIVEAVLKRILTPEFVRELLEETRAAFCDTARLEQEAEKLISELAEVEKKILNLVKLAEDGSLRIVEQLKQREAEQARLECDLRQIEAKRRVARVEISPEALTLAIKTWIQQVEQTREAGDVRALKKTLARFVSKVELGYNTARIWYTFPIGDALHADNGSGMEFFRSTFG